MTCAFVPLDAGRAVVTWEGPGESIVLTLYGPDGEEAALPLSSKRALSLAQELLTRGVQAIKADQADPGSSLSYVPPTPPRGPARVRSRVRARGAAS